MILIALFSEVLFNVILVIAILLSSFYGILMWNYVSAWRSLSSFSAPSDGQPSTKIDVIIPARNEGANIAACLQSIFKNSYSSDLFQVYVVDDFSRDQTADIVEDIMEEYSNLHLIRMHHFPEEEKNAFKKAAIKKGIESGRGELIVCTDADCIVPQNWLWEIATYYEQTQVQFIAAPVLFHQEKGKLGQFQSLDFAGMMLITGAGIHQSWMHMSNGANLAYTRNAFQKVNGFQGIDQLASGDDMLLMQKIAQAFPGQLGFLKSNNAVVQTLPQSSYRDFVRQRIRWASKSSHYPEWKVTAALAGVFFFCWAIVLSFLLIPFAPGFFSLLLLSLFTFKSVIDYLLLREACLFFHRKELLQSFITSQLHHILYICWVGLMANFQKRYVWKGRKVR